VIVESLLSPKSASGSSNVNAWNEITLSTIQNGFSKAGTQTYDKSIQDAEPIDAAKDTAIDEETVSQDKEMKSESDKENENELSETTEDMFIDDDSEDELVRISLTVSTNVLSRTINTGSEKSIFVVWDICK